MWIALKVLRAYKLLISPYFAGSCRFLPSCAEYAAEALMWLGDHEPVPARIPSRGRSGAGADRLASIGDGQAGYVSVGDGLQTVPGKLYSH